MFLLFFEIFFFNFFLPKVNSHLNFSLYFALITVAVKNQYEFLLRKTNLDGQYHNSAAGNQKMPEIIKSFTMNINSGNTSDCGNEKLERSASFKGVEALSFFITETLTKKLR